MKQKDLVRAVLEHLFSNGCFPDPVPSKINVCGGEDSVREEVISGMAQKYVDSNIGEGFEGAYNVDLNPFIRKSREEYQEAQKNSLSSSR